MDPAGYSVYNMTRNVLLSERVISVSEPQTPAQLLAFVMNGPARDPHFCIRLTNVSIAPDIPRLFAFDVAYLDSEQRILEFADVGPGTPFPPLTENVATILFLSDQLLENSGTEVGDFIRICTEAELAAVLRATAQFHATEPGSPVESSVPLSTIPPDPFAGSLIFLPASGPPQSSEIFLASPVPNHPALEQPAAPESEESPVELTASAPAVSDEPSSTPLDETDPPQEPKTQHEEQPVPSPYVPASQFFETDLPPTPPLEAASTETRPTSSPQTYQLPFSLKAVMQFVDDQLRREKQQVSPDPLPQFQTQSDQPPHSESWESSFGAETTPPGDQPFEPVPSETLETEPAAPIEAVFESTELNELQHQLTEPQSSLETASEQVTAPVAASAPPNHQQLISREAGLVSEPVYDASVPVEPVRLAHPQPALPSYEPSPAPVLEHTPPSPKPIAEPEPAPPISPKEKLPFATRVQRWLAGESISLSGNRRRGERLALPGLVAFYFTGGAPKPHEILNISSSGLYLRSKEQWYPNTLVRMTLERQDLQRGENKSISVLARVVRIDDGGIGHEFVTTEVLSNLRTRDFLPQEGTSRKELDKFLAAPK